MHLELELNRHRTLRFFGLGKNNEYEKFTKKNPMVEIKDAIKFFD